MSLQLINYYYYYYTITSLDSPVELRGRGRESEREKRETSNTVGKGENYIHTTFRWEARMFCIPVTLSTLVERLVWL